MRKNINVIVVLSILALSALIVAGAQADDSALSVEMPRNAKVGHTEIRTEYERLADGDVWESTMTCTKITNKITKCVSMDDLGWNQTIVCKGEKCNTVASR